MKIILITCAILLLCNLLPAQHKSEIDSLENALVSATPTEKTEILNRLSMIYQNISIEKSIEYDLQNLELNQEQGKKKNQSTILNNLAISYYISGQYYKSIENFEQSLSIFEEFNDTLVIMKTLNNLGVLTQTVGQYDKALDYLQRSLLYKLNKNDTLSIAKTLNNIGVIYMNIGQTEESRKFLTQAFEYYTIMNDQGCIADLYNNLGQLYYANAKTDSALNFYNKSLEIKKQIGDEQGAGNTLNNIGIIYSDKNMYEKSIKYFKEAQKIRKKTGDIFGLSSTTNNLANLYLAKQDYQQALELYNASNDIAEKENIRGIIKRNYAGISRLYEKTGEHSKALKYYKLLSKINDSIFSDDFNKRLADLKIQYEIKQNERENKILKQKNQIQDLQISLYNKQKILLIIAVILILIMSVVVVLLLNYLNRKKISKQLKELNFELKRRVKERTLELELTNKTKDQFLAIIAHDLKTPFNSILGFSEILSMDFDDMDDPKRKEMAGLINLSANNAYKLLENILEWASVQNGKLKLLPENLNIKDLINESINITTVYADKKNLSISFNTGIDHCAYADKNTVKTVIRNILSNAVKFTPQGGNIEISIENFKAEDTKKDYLKVSVSDNGVGISEENLKNIFNIDSKFRTEGTDNEPGTGMGIVLCREFVNKNNGRIWAESTLGKGSTFLFTLPKT